MTLPAGFPRYQLPARKEIYRIHKRSPWWFSSDGSGRFDPVGTGMGACYLAEEPLGAWVEVFRKTMLIADGDAKCRRLLSVALTHSLELADFTSRHALQFGVTASLSGDSNYSASHQRAAEAAAGGLAGVRYFARHDPAQQLYGIALFGPAGDHPSWTAMDHSVSAALPTPLIDSARQTFGYRVIPVP